MIDTSSDQEFATMRVTGGTLEILEQLGVDPDDPYSTERALRSALPHKATRDVKSFTITNVVEIYDNGEFVSIVMQTGSVVHLPMDSEHSIVVQDMPDPGDHYRVDVSVDFYA